MWRVPRIWGDGDCFIFGGGPSLTDIFDIPSEVVLAVTGGEAPLSEYSPFLSPLHNKHTIAINGTYKLGLWVDVCFFGDNSWYLGNRQALASWPKLKVSCAPWFASRTNHEAIKYLGKDPKRLGISTDRTKLCWGHHSGCAAINLAAHLGAKRIYLIGFDMKLSHEGRSHCHFEYRTASKHPPFRIHLRAYPFIAEDARKMGIQVINLSPNSAIKDLPVGRPPWKT